MNLTFTAINLTIIKLMLLIANLLIKEVFFGPENHLASVNHLQSLQISRYPLQSWWMEWGGCKGINPLYTQRDCPNFHNIWGDCLYRIFSLNPTPVPWNKMITCEIPLVCYQNISLCYQNCQNIFLSCLNICVCYQITFLCYHDIFSF